jgi:lysophospholipase L1-like esterase
VNQPGHSNWQGVASAALAIVLVALLAEVGLRMFSPVPSPYEEIERLKPRINQYIRFEYPKYYAAVTEAEPGLPGLSGMHQFTTNNMGFRGDPLLDPKPPREFRVFMVGGSTTECFYLDDKDDIARVVQRELSAVAPEDTTIRVYNVGLSGAASDDHVAMISQRLVHLEPDLVVVFCGINDLSRSIYNYDYRHYVEYQPAYRKPWFKRWPMQLQLVRRLSYFRQRVRRDAQRLQEQRPLVSNYAGLVGLQRSVPPTDTPPRTNETSYATNLRSIAGLATGNDFKLVFMTQQTTWNSTVDPSAKNRHWMRYRAGVQNGDATTTGITFREDFMDAAMERLNDTMRAVSVEAHVPLHDLARTLPKSTEFFYDDCHFNTAGAARAGKELADFLIAQRLTPRRNFRRPKEIIRSVEARNRRRASRAM